MKESSSSQLIFQEREKSLGMKLMRRVIFQATRASSWISKRTRKCKLRRKKAWIRKLFQGRESKGHYHTLVQEMRFFDRESFFR